MKKNKWSNPKGSSSKKIKTTIRTIGFNSFSEMQDYIKRNKIKPKGYGYNKKDKHFVEWQ